IALAIHDETGKYACHAGATLASVFVNTAQPVCAHILHDDTLTLVNRERLERIGQAAGKKVRFCQIRLPKILEDIKAGPFTIGTLYRLLMPEMLAAERVLYLDCDLIADLDIAELWNEPLHDHPLAAVLDTGVKGLDLDHQRRLRRAGLSLDLYFNAGVMILDLARIRRDQDLVSSFLPFLQHFPESLMVDQDYLNWVFQDNYCCLLEKYNTLVKRYRNMDKVNRKIWHYSGQKPWVRYESPTDALYWRALALTPWRDEALDGLLGAVDTKMRLLLNSRSWRMTQPYRAAGHWMRSHLGWFR
ncbi:MAG: glycosyltransferase family 8 protein, partial [Deltaproteobacteria bacterium]